VNQKLTVAYRAYRIKNDNGKKLKQKNHRAVPSAGKQSNGWDGRDQWLEEFVEKVVETMDGDSGDDVRDEITRTCGMRRVRRRMTVI